AQPGLMGFRTCPKFGQVEIPFKESSLAEPKPRDVVNVGTPWPAEHAPVQGLFIFIEIHP
ncbi:MAG TPA: hypothetical protein PKX64_08760, partial [Elusimicrobiota bacterium]|nr:hypothetical protein [Elusimicrobiota bacterium]